MKVTIDPKLKNEVPRTALGCVTAQVEAGGVAGRAARRNEGAGERNPEIGLSRAAYWRPPQVEATRMRVQVSGENPSRYRGSAEALLRRVVAGRFAANQRRGDVINLVSVESGCRSGCMTGRMFTGEIGFSARGAPANIQRHWQIRFESGGNAGRSLIRLGRTGGATSDSNERW